MKLGALKSAIRAGDHVRICFNLGGQHPINVAVQKTSLLEQLDAAFPEGRAQETGLYLRDDGFIMRETQP